MIENDERDVVAGNIGTAQLDVLPKLKEEIAKCNRHHKELEDKLAAKAAKKSGCLVM